MEKDLVSLHQVMHKMSIETWNLYNVNITKYSTISALAMAIFKTNFLSSDSLLTTAKGDLEKAIRSAYYGGGSDVYNPVGTNLYCYDANSLYPASMLKPLPVGIPVYSLNKDLSQLFGFVKATVTTPENCTKPTLPYRIESEDGDRLVFPVGT